MKSTTFFIIIKGQPKAQEIDRIDRAGNGVYEVRFKSGPKTYHYRNEDVVVLKECVWHDNQNCKVRVNGREQHNIETILSFQQGKLTHWRIAYQNGIVIDYLHGSIQVLESCLGDKIAKNTFCYLKRIAQVNDLGKSEESGGILPALYEKLEFIDQSLAIAPYLDPSRFQIKRRKTSDLIFPFGCNSSQEKAVVTAFENQISVIQGPPGTGKTQTILNIIANILVQGKTVIVVSNNNSATENVLEKLNKYGLGFIVAPLGKRENKDSFINNQPSIPQELSTWHIDKQEARHKEQEVAGLMARLRKIYKLQEELAVLKREKKDVELELEHFKLNNRLEDDSYTVIDGVKSRKIMDLWLRVQNYVENDTISTISFFRNLISQLQKIGLVLLWKRVFKFRSRIKEEDLVDGVTKLQAQYLLVRMKEIDSRVGEIEKTLKSVDAKKITDTLTTLSLDILKKSLFDKYHEEPRRVFHSVKELHLMADEVCKQYPVILSTTFSARTAIPGRIYDYIIMDEASQVSIETGALAMTCAKNAVIVGDTMQLPNVVTEEDGLVLDGIFREFKVPQGYNCVENSFLMSICAVLPNIKQTLLREHYRCHPTIINFCNQRFYGGSLLVMTENHNEEDVMMAIKTVPGHHCRNHYNQREIDVVKNEVLPFFENCKDIGIITPYNNQVNEFNRQIPTVEAATIHKYQGREKDTIILSVVDDQITEFSDDANLINVAISRAKQHFILVVSGNEQERTGTISDLVGYIEYHNLTVKDSKICSIFDYLYSHYTKERLAFLKGHKKVSEYDSENLTYSLIETILNEVPQFRHLGVLCHMPLRSVIRNWYLLDDMEIYYISHFSTHLDFLIINHVTKKPVLAIETDGYSYHNDTTEQHNRDLMKDHILEVYGLPLLRLGTHESGERERIIAKVKESLAQGIWGQVLSHTKSEGINETEDD